jgi:hypothetical protein
MLKKDPPQLRTEDALLKKNEQILDGMERGLLTPKIAEQMGQCVKTPIALVRLEMQYLRTLAMFGRKAPVPRSPLLRSMIPGLDPDKVSAADAEKVHGYISGAVEGAK